MQANGFGAFFNSLNAEFEPIPAIIPSSNLKINGVYRVNALRGVNTKYGPKIVADLTDHGTLFLPNRYVQRFLKKDDNPKRFRVDCANTALRLKRREPDRYNTPIYEFFQLRKGQVFEKELIQENYSQNLNFNEDGNADDDDEDYDEVDKENYFDKLEPPKVNTRKKKNAAASNSAVLQQQQQQE